MTPTPRITVRSALGSITMLWISTAIAATAFWPVYESREFVVMVAVTTLLGTAIAAACAVYRWPAHIVALLTVLAYALFGVPLAIPNQALLGVLPSLAGVSDLLVATATSWKQLVTIAIPVGSYQALLVPAFLLTLVTVTVSLSIALRSSRRELATLGPVVLFVGGIALGSSAAFQPVWQALALLAVLLLWLVGFARGRRVTPGTGTGEGDGASAADPARRPAIRVFASAAVVIVMAGAAAAGAVSIAPPARERIVVRSTIPQPFDPLAETSPLSGFRRYLQAPQVDQTMLSVVGLPPGARLRIATLDSYDGVVYSVGSSDAGGASGEFALVPSSLDQSQTAGTTASIVVTVGAYRGVWVPSIGSLERISFGGTGAAQAREAFYVNQNSGTAADLRLIRGGETYRIDAILPTQPEADDLARLTPGTAPVPALPVTPEGLSAAVDRYVGQTDRPGARLQAAIDGMRKEGYLSHGVAVGERASRSGHSADRITELFTDPQMIGDQEQYAVAAAIMARSVGFPARVVMGFAPAAPAGTAAVTTITGADISAWIEVDTAEFGWVTLDAAPLERQIPDLDDETPAPVARPQSPVQPPAAVVDPPDEQQPPESVSDDARDDDPAAAVLRTVALVGGVSLLTLAVVLAPALAILVAKLRRRRLRRRRPSSLGRISGAWQEFTDSALDHGVTPPRSPTRSELAAAVGGTAPLALAATADRAVFAPEGVTTADADRMWRTVDELRVTLERGLTWRARWRARLSLRSLGLSPRR